MESWIAIGTDTTRGRFHAVTPLVEKRHRSENYARRRRETIQLRVSFRLECGAREKNSGRDGHGRRVDSGTR